MGSSLVTAPHRALSSLVPRPPAADGGQGKRGGLRLAGEPDSPVAQGRGGLTHGPAHRRSTRDSHVTRGGDVRVVARVPACRHCARMATPCARSLKRRCHFRLKGGTLTETQEQQLDMTGRSAAREPLTHYAGWSCSLRSSPPISHTRRSCSSSRPKPRCPFDRPTVTQARIAGATPPPAGSPRSPPPARCRRSRSEGIHGRSGCSETP